MNPAFNTADLVYQLPLLILVLGGILALLADAFAGGPKRAWVASLSLGVVIVALLAAIYVFRDLAPNQSVKLYGGMLVADRFGLLTTIIFLIAAGFTLLLAGDYLHEHGVHHGEFHPLVLFGTAGMAILALSTDLVSIFIGIETMSLAVYVLTGAFRRQRRSQEAAMKYFLMGAFASAFLLYGIALVYGTAGTTNLFEIGAHADNLARSQLFGAGQLMILAALGFKVAAAPFHMWTPDAYEGAPTPVSGYMAAGVKAAGFTVLLRLFLTAFGGDMAYGPMGWATILGILGAATMIIGNLAALRQENVKRLLAYSSIAHAGYLLVGVVAAGVGAEDAARPAILYYLIAYTFTTVGSFGVIAWLGRQGDERLLVDDWAGLGQRHPAAALAMTIFLLSAGGIPPTAGFFAKFYVLRSAMDVTDGQLLWLVVVAVASSVVSAAYYLRIVMSMYFREVTRPHDPIRSGKMTTALVLAAGFVLLQGLLPGSWLEIAGSALMAK